MRVLVIDQDRCGLDFAMRAAAAGHEVRWFAWTKKPSKIGQGIKGIQMVDDWRTHMPWAKDGLIFMTANNRYLTEIDRYRADFGYKVFGPTAASARLEIDRKAGMEAFRSIGVELPPYQEVNSYEEAETLARKSDKVFVFKPTGDSDDKASTYASSSPADMVGWLQRRIAAGKKLTAPAVMQEKIDRLAEIGVSGWMGPEGFLPDRWSFCWEHKPLYPGDIGQNTGEQGSVLQYLESDKLADDMLKPLEPVLRALGHSGDFAVGAMLDTKGRAWPLEFTARCGYPAWWIQSASHRGDPVQWMYDLVRGRDSLKVSYDAAIGVVVSQPQYPNDTAPADMVEGIPIQGADDVLDDIHLVEAMRGRGPVMDGGKVVERPVFETAGEYVLVATGLGKTVTQAQKRVYGTIDKVKFPQKGYRNDIGDKVKAQLAAVQRAGYALDMEP